MKQATITTKTDKGEKALQIHIEESFKVAKTKKLMFKMLGFSQEVISQKPLVLKIELRKKVYQTLVQSKDFMQTIESAMLENGAKKDIDYIIEVE